jgi:hypothetical protein
VPRFYLELYNGHGWLDGAEPAEFADYDAAHAFALYSIRDLVSAEVREGKPVELGHFIAICDDAGCELRRVPFREAVAFTDHGDPNVPIIG